MIGKTLGHYQILDKIGAGGMGEVYRARDERLGRDVAIKVLPEAFAADPERLVRFQQEARLLASLNHPNIAAIYGLEEADATRLLVMELVPGQTLAEQVAGGPLPVEEALTICRQMAEALEAAHERGIIHRDLKPGNIKVTPEGKVKVLDFGLAKAFAGDESALDLSRSPTISAGTRAGTLLGTAAYMSPEQARGKPVDKRTDIWAFGCVLYESLTGQQAFCGETISDTLAKILKDEPDWSVLPAATPPTVQLLLRRCLQKDPARRLHDIADARLELDDAVTTPATPTVAALVAVPAPRMGPLSWLALGVAAGIVVGAITVLTLSKWAPSETGGPRGVKQFTISLPESAPMALARLAPLGVGRTSFALSPDGTQLVYAADRGETSLLYRRPLGQLEAQPIPGTEGAYAPFFSPDGLWVGFFAADKLKKVSLQGGEPVVLCEARNPLGGSWGTDDSIAFADSEGGFLVRIPAAGGARRIVSRSFECASPHILPGGKAILLTDRAVNNPDYSQIVALNLETGERRTILQGGTHPHFVPTGLPRAKSSGHLIFARAGSLMAAPFDLARLTVTAEPVLVVPGVRSEAYGHAQYSISNDGTLAYLAGASGSIGRPVWVDRQGRATPTKMPEQTYGTFRLARDGRRLAIVVAGATDDVWVYEFDRGAFIRLTLEGQNLTPVWTPDGKRVTFKSIKTGSPGIFWKAADGSGPEELLARAEAWPSSWSPDGKVLAFTADTGTGSDLWTLSLEDGRTAKPFLRTQYAEWGAAFSPDGRWIAYTSDESGRYEVYVRPYPGPGAKWQISTGGGEEPAWSPDGRELFYRNGVKWMAAPIQTTPEFRAGTPRVMFEGYYLNVWGPSFAVAPDGKGFLMIDVGAKEAAARELNVVVNWFEELKRRVPAAKK